MMFCPNCRYVLTDDEKPDLTLREMQRRSAWVAFAAGIASIRFHPKNDEKPSEIDSRVNLAAVVADQMLERYDRAFPEDAP
jgi:hypothetical protein